jgi:folate-binding protein YgfZ
MTDLSESVRMVEAARRTGIYFLNRQTSWVDVRGADAESHLQAMVTQDLSDFGVGERRLAALADDRGHYLADFWVFRNNTGWHLEIAESLAEEIAKRLTLFAVAADVVLTVRGQEQTLFHLEGPESIASLVQVLGMDEGLASAQTGSVTRNGEEIEYLRRSMHGEEGWTFSVPRDQIEAFRLAVEDLADVRGWKRASPEIQELLRIEAGRPLAGKDLSSEDLLQEAGFDDAVSLDKGCYPGQEMLQRVSRQGSLKRKLCTVRFAPGMEEGFAPGQAVTRGDRTIGRVTSYASDPRDGSGLGLAWLTAEGLRFDECFELGVGDKMRSVTIIERPLYRGGIGVLPEVWRGPGRGDE